MRDPCQTAFLNRVRQALGNPCDRPDPFARSQPEVAEDLFQRIANRTRKERKALMDRLWEAAGPIHLQVVLLQDERAAAHAVCGLVRDTTPEWGTEKRVVAWDHPMLHSLELREALSEQKVPVAFTEPLNERSAANGHHRTRCLVQNACIGITSADVCVADTATLVMKTRPGQARSVSLVPSVHVAVIRLHQIVADLTELYALLQRHPDHKTEGLTRCMTFISGPSKTADIEFTMVHGAHGPREVHLLVIAG